MNHKLHAQNCLERANVHVTVSWRREALGEPQSPDPTGSEQELLETKDNSI